MMLKDEFITAALTDAKSFCAQSALDYIEDHTNNIIDNAKSSVALKDSFGNSVVGTGTDNKLESFNSYGFDNDTMNWPLWLALYNDSWVFRRAIDKPSQDIVNAGFRILSDHEVDYTKIYKEFEKVKFDMIKLVSWGTLFGGAVGVMMFDTVSDYEMQYPLRKAKLHKAKMRLYITDRWYGVSAETETVTNMRDIDFGKPRYYNITFADGRTVRVHHSYVLRYEHRTAPRLIKNGQLQGWGYAEGAHILNELSRDDQLKAAITTLINKANIEVVHMAGMRGVFMGADKGNEEQLRKRLEMVTWGRNYNSLTFLDKDDVYEQHSLSGVEGLSSLLETNMWLVSAAVEMPSVLFGELKGGLSQESDAYQRYADVIKTRADSYYRPILQKILTVFAVMYEYDDVIEFEFKSLIQKELNDQKVDSIKNYTETLTPLVDLGLITKYQAAKCLDNFIHKGVVDIIFSDDQFEKLALEADLDAIEIYKAMGKEKTQEPLAEAQFPQGVPQNVELPEKLEYLREAEAPTAVVETESEPAPTQAEQPQNEVYEDEPEEE